MSQGYGSDNGIHYGTTKRDRDYRRDFHPQLHIRITLATFKSTETHDPFF
jgi:hypothetical protein